MGIVELKGLPSEELYLINGLPDVGLVGTIASVHMIRQLNMEEVAYFDSENLPPVMVLHEGRPKMPVRMYYRDSICALTSEIPINLELARELAKDIVNFAKDRNIKLVISMGGIATPNRIEIKEPKVYGVVTSEQYKRKLREIGIETLEEGFIVGAYALILKECLQKGMPCLLLLAQSHSAYPDPGAAASVLKALSKFLDLPIDVSPLLKEAERWRIKLRELMRRTNVALARMQKSQEYELPPMMYV